MNCRIIVGAGATSDPIDKEGIAHLAEHMFFKTSKQHSSIQVKEMLSRLGNSNASTSHNRTVYELDTLPANEAKARRILTELFEEPNPTQEELDKEKGVICQEISMSNNDPMSYFIHNMFEHWFGRRYHSILGSVESVSSITLENLRDFRAMYYQDPIMVVCGDTDETEQSIYNLGPTIVVNDPALRSMEDKHIHHSSTQAGFALFYNIDDSLNEHLQDLIVNIIGDGMHSLLFRRLRDELGLCYIAQAFTIDSPRNGRSVGIVTMLDKANLAVAEKEIIKIIDGVIAGDISQDLFETARSNLEFTTATMFETSSRKSRFLNDRYFHGKPPFENDWFVQEMRTATILKVATEARAMFGSGTPKMKLTMTND